MPKPVLMTVDDDPGVSRSVARDLRPLRAELSRRPCGVRPRGPRWAAGAGSGVERPGGVRRRRRAVAGDVRAESVERVASAVGEGAMAVTLVHRYLAEQ